MKAALSAVLACLPAAALAQPICLAPDARAPFTDGEFLGCGDGLPRLTLVREDAVYDPELGEWRQSVVLRFANPLDEQFIVSGVLDVVGAELVGEPIYAADELRRGDFDWAIAPLSHYEDPGDCSALADPPPPHATRGLEFGDLMRSGAHRVRFEFAAAADLDDIRVVVASPDPAAASEIRLTVFDVLTTDGVEVQVGAAEVDAVPDDGLYPVDGDIAIRLRALDLDIDVDCISGPADAAFAFELSVPGIPPERAGVDPRADRNGELGPVPALGAPRSLRWRPTALTSAAGDSVLVADLEGLDLALCADGDRSLPLSATIEPVDGLPDGVYLGELDVWDDTDGNRRFDADEIGDAVRLAVVVGPEPAIDPCEAPVDAGVPGDAGLDGAVESDAAPDAAADAALDSTADAALDAGAGIDLDAATDATLDATPDAASEVGVDGTLDASVEPGSDLGADLPDGARDATSDGRSDAGVDEGVDGGAPALDVAVDGPASDADPIDAGADVEPADTAVLDGEPADAAVADSALDAIADDAIDGAIDGATDSAADAGPDGEPDGAADGRLDGSPDPADGSSDGPIETDGGDDMAGRADSARDDGGRPDAMPDGALDDRGDPRGGALMCHAQPGRAPSGPWWLAALVLVARMRRRPGAGALAVLLAAGLTLMTAEARAQADIRRFTPTTTSSPYANLDGTATLGSGDVAARILSVVERRPLVFARDGDRTVDIVSVRLGLDAALAVGLTDWLDVGAGLPLVLAQDGRRIADDAPLDGFALADPVFAAKARLVPASTGIGLALRLGATAPLGDADALAGEQGPTGTARLAFELPISSRFDVVVNVGYRLREATRLGDIALDDELLFGAGASWRATPDFALALEFDGATAADAPFSVEQQTPGGLDLLARVGIVDDVAAVAGVGAGLLPGYGSPMFRAVAGLQYAPRNHDFDGDGLADRRDDCVDAPGEALERGCPAPERIAAAEPEAIAPSRDKDGDDILDGLDQCPYLPEDRDGFRDDDGCPDPDNDLDLLADGFDADPLGPEDWDGFEDADGIPDPDNDRDGVADFRDPCPDEKGGPDGCPGSLRPDAPAGGGDAIAEAGGPQAPLVLGRTVHPAEPIIFEFARPELTPEALPLVDGLARYLVEHPELDRVEVGVHVDAMGSRRWKHWLSRARAESVVAALVARGVPAARVFPRGYGPEVPVDSNRTEAGRSNNRRVELRALRAFETARPTRAVRKGGDRGKGREGRRPSAPRPAALPPPRPRWLPPDTLVLRPNAPIVFSAEAAIVPASRPRVAELAARLRANPGWRRVEVAVHTDGVGDPDGKLRTSRRRAVSVVDALVEAGVERDRLEPRGYGALRRLVGDETDAHRSRNERVELVVLDSSVSLGPGGAP